LDISGRPFAQAKNMRTFAARKRGSGPFKQAAENKRNKICGNKKGSYLCNPKTGALKSEDAESDFQY
jgi:hypothetical protein